MADNKPDILLVGPSKPLLAKGLESAFTVHRLIEAKDRGQKIHDLLEDIASLVDEVDDNVQNYNERSADLRKPLKQVVEMDSEFQGKLRELKIASADPKHVDEAADYKFSLEDAIDSVNRSADATRKLLEEQNVKFAKKKKS